ncbi:MAG: translation elongation factor Ts [Gammaproteobacteria bacterium]|nr:translation elongation factor Ts [Gammaproteobacteria bacterium]
MHSTTFKKSSAFSYKGRVINQNPLWRDNQLEITAVMVKELREMTGAGIMDCKKVLAECAGDQEKAVELLRIKGAQKAESRAGRTATEGIVVCQVSPERDCGALVEINSETDFVSRGEVFRAFALPLAGIALSIDEDCEDLSVLNGLPFDDSGKTVEDARQEMLLKISENISIRRMTVIKAATGSKIGSYVHRERLGVMVEIAGGDSDTIADSMAVHVAVMKPKWVDVDGIPADVIEGERRIYLSQAQETGKPEFVLQKIVDGKINKFSNENTLMNQPYYDDEDKKVSTLLKESGVSVTRFCLMDLGK